MESCGGDIAFPAEDQPYNVIDTLTFTLPEGFSYQSGSARHTFILDGGPTSTEVIADPLIISGLPGQSLCSSASLPGIIQIIMTVQPDYDRIIFNAVLPAKQTGDYNYSMEAKGRYQFYADKAGIRWVKQRHPNPSPTLPPWSI